MLHLPIACNQFGTRGVIQKYILSVRCEGPYLAGNVYFVIATTGLTGQ